MNDVSAASIPFFAVGPSAILIRWPWFVRTTSFNVCSVSAYSPGYRLRRRSSCMLALSKVPPLTIQQDKGPSIQLVEGKAFLRVRSKPGSSSHHDGSCFVASYPAPLREDGNLFVRVQWTSRCLPGQQPVSVQPAPDVCKAKGLKGQ